MQTDELDQHPSLMIFPAINLHEVWGFPSQPRFIAESGIYIIYPQHIPMI